MSKRIFCTVLLTLSVLTACSKLKERELKDMIGEKKPATTDELIAKANSSPSFETLTAAGFSLSQSKKPELALTYFEKALAFAPKSSVALNNLCAENNNLGRYEKAISYCEQAIALAADFQLAKNNLKFAQDKKEAQLKLIADLKEKSKSAKGPDRQSAFIDLGFEYYKMGNYDEAVAIWKKIPKSNDPLYVRTLNNLGSAYIIMKKFDLAKSSLEEASKIEPQNQLIKNNMAWLQTESTAVTK